MRNELNQYERVSSSPDGRRLKYDPDGNLTHMYAAADVNQDGRIDIGDLAALLAAMDTCVGQSGYDPDADIDGSGCIDISDHGYVLALFGQPSNAVALTWDAENRLVGYEPILPAEGDMKVEFGYDYRNRRIWKKVYEWEIGDPNDTEDDAWAAAPSSHRKFVWNDWLMMLELDGNDDSVIRRYTWGLDLSGQHGVINSLAQTAGIGGLLAIQDDEFDTSPTSLLASSYDGNGNLTQLLLCGDGSFQAQYEYDPYGNIHFSSGAYAIGNPVRYSTCYSDRETTMAYCGYRYYAPKFGRWLNRDPLLERGGQNIYAYVVNNTVNMIDPLGLSGRHIVDPPAQGDGESTCDYLSRGIKALLNQLEQKVGRGYRNAIDSCERGFENGVNIGHQESVRRRIRQLEKMMDDYDKNCPDHKHRCKLPEVKERAKKFREDWAKLPKESPRVEELAWPWWTPPDLVDKVVRPGRVAEDTAMCVAVSCGAAACGGLIIIVGSSVSVGAGIGIGIGVAGS